MPAIYGYVLILRYGISLISIIEVKPKLILANRLTETTIKLQWAVPIQVFNSLERYRIQLSTNNFVTSQDWPGTRLIWEIVDFLSSFVLKAQITRVSYDTSEIAFKSSRKNNIDCFNECIQNIECFVLLKIIFFVFHIY